MDAKIYEKDDFSIIKSSNKACYHLIIDDRCVELSEIEIGVMITKLARHIDGWRERTAKESERDDKK